MADLDDEDVAKLQANAQASAEALVGGAAEGTESGNADGNGWPTTLSTIWECEMIKQDTNRFGKRIWRCMWCGYKKTHPNATKALAHVLRLNGKDVKTCKKGASITPQYMDRYRDLRRQNDAKTESWKLANQAVQDAVESQ